MRDSLAQRLACEIARQPVVPGLWLVRFEQSGDALVRFGPGTDGARAALARVDADLGRLLECFRAADLLQSSAFIITGDRSLQPLHTLAYPNVVLESIGLVTSAPGHVNVDIAAWQALVRSYGGAAVVYATEEDSAVLARRALSAEAQRTRAFRVVSAAELAPLHADPQAWFGLEAAPGYALATPSRGATLGATELRGVSGYLPTQPGSTVGFVAWGSGIRGGVRVPSMSQIDIAPTVAALLGVSLPLADGSPLIGILGATPAIGGGPR